MENIKDMDILVAIVSILVSSGLSVFLAYLSMNRKLERILEQDYKGVLNKDQANELLKLYLADIRRELNREIDDFCDRRLEDILIDIQKDTFLIRIRNTLERKYHTTQELVANRYSKFKIYNGKYFVDLLDSVSRDISANGLDRVSNELTNYFRNNPIQGSIEAHQIQSFKELISAQMVEANTRGKSKLELMINSIYKDT